MTLASDVVARARQRLMTGQRDVLNQLQGAINSSVTSFALKRDLLGITPNARLSVDLEDMHVWSVSGTTAGSTVEVLRAQNGTTAASHSADALVYVKAQVSDFDILTAINEELHSLSAEGLFRIKTVELTYSATKMGYDLTGVGSDFLDIWRVRMDEVGTERDWPILHRDDWRLDQDANTADFPSGKQFVLFRSTTPGRKVRVSYKATFAQLATLADNVESVSGLHAEAVDLLSLGAVIRLGAGRDIKRSFMEAQHEPRRADEVPPGSASSALRTLLGLREMRISEERARLMKRYPE